MAKHTQEIERGWFVQDLIGLGSVARRHSQNPPCPRLCQRNMARGEHRSRGCGSARACCRSIRPAEHPVPARDARTPTLLPSGNRCLVPPHTQSWFTIYIPEVYKFAQTAPLVYEKVRSIS